MIGRPSSSKGIRTTNHRIAGSRPRRTILSSPPCYLIGGDLDSFCHAPRLTDGASSRASMSQFRLIRDAMTWLSGLGRWLRRADSAIRVLPSASVACPPGAEVKAVSSGSLKLDGLCSSARIERVQFAQSAPAMKARLKTITSAAITRSIDSMMFDPMRAEAHRGHAKWLAPEPIAKSPHGTIPCH